MFARIKSTIRQQILSLLGSCAFAETHRLKWQANSVKFNGAIKIHFGTFYTIPFPLPQKLGNEIVEGKSENENEHFAFNNLWPSYESPFPITLGCDKKGHVIAHWNRRNRQRLTAIVPNNGPNNHQHGEPLM